jgi:hypothetical protein
MSSSSTAGNLARVAIALGLGFASGGLQAALVLTGNYVNVGISNFGTFGSGGSTPPGIQHDPTGTGTFGVSDYLTPGTPHDGFGIVSDQTGFRQNSNAGGSVFVGAAPTLLVGPGALGFANAATWAGSFGGVTITNSYFFNPNDERVLIKSVITATSDLTNLSFVRSTDPDPDVNTFGTFVTENQRGNLLYDPEDFIGSAGDISGLFLGFLNDSGDTYVHNTRIDTFCCATINPNTVLGGGVLSSVGDHGLNMAWRIGDLGAGESATISYFYVFGTNIDNGGGVPEPGTLALLGLGLGLASLATRRRRRTA